MQLLGLILGFFLGSLVLGPLGALLGAFLGYHFILGLKQQSFSQPSTNDSLILVRTLFTTLGYLNKLKGRVTEQDIQIAEQRMYELQLNDSACVSAQQAFREGKQPHFSLRQQLRTFQKVAATRPDWRQIFLQVQLQAALQTGLHLASVQQVLQLFIEELPLSPRQLQQLLSLLADQGAFSQQSQHHHYHHFRWQGAAQEHFQQQRAYHQTATRNQALSLTEAYQILGTQPDDEPATIKRAYRKLMLQHHPDKLAAKGLSKAQMEQTKQRAQKIQAAFDLIKRQRNFK